MIVDVISPALHYAQDHFDNKNRSIKLSFINHRLFNTIIPSKAVIKLRELGPCLSLCNWTPTSSSTDPIQCKLATKLPPC